MGPYTAEIGENGNYERLFFFKTFFLLYENEVHVQHLTFKADIDLMTVI